MILSTSFQLHHHPRSSYYHLHVVYCDALLVSLHSLPTNSLFSLNWEWFLNKAGHFMSLFKSLQWLPSDVRVRTTILIMICKAQPCLVPFSPQSHFLLHNPSLLVHLSPTLPASRPLLLSFLPAGICCSSHFAMLVLFFSQLTCHLLKATFPESLLLLLIHPHQVGSTQLLDLIELLHLKQVIIKYSFSNYLLMVFFIRQ